MLICSLLHDKLAIPYFMSLFTCKSIDDSHLCHFFRWTARAREGRQV